MADFTCDSNEALELALVRAGEDTTQLKDPKRFKFHPTFTYPIFGEQEKIYGYKGLAIKLHFASGSLAQFLSISWSSKLPHSTADDVEGTLYKYIPPDFTKSEAAFKERVELDAKQFKPLGTKIHSYTYPSTSKQSGDDEDVVYEAYHATWKVPGFREYHRRMQIFILLYIEAGSYIDEEEDRWEFVTLYEKRTRKDRTETYHFVGYTSLYPFWFYPDKTRLRLSQFVILPPYHRQSHGSRLYSAVYNFVIGREDVGELTVEDPSEAFEDLRDKNDLLMLLAHEQFISEAYGPSSTESEESENVKTKGEIGPPANKVWVEKWRKTLKMAGRQFHRLIEMLIQHALKPGDEITLRKYRLQVKERLFRFNFEQLMQLEKEERLEKLEETFQNVTKDYDRLLELVR